jgi:hypothetical protein
MGVSNEVTATLACTTYPEHNSVVLWMSGKRSAVGDSRRMLPQAFWDQWSIQNPQLQSAMSPFLLFEG